MAYNELLFWASITYGYHLPASMVPVGASPDSLPLGVQIAGTIFGDLTVAESRRAVGAGQVIIQAAFRLVARI